MHRFKKYFPLLQQNPVVNNLPHLLKYLGGVNIAEALVSKGLATVVRYAADNDQRSSRYSFLFYSIKGLATVVKYAADNDQRSSRYSFLYL